MHGLVGGGGSSNWYVLHKLMSCTSRALTGTTLTYCETGFRRPTLVASGRADRRQRWPWRRGEGTGTLLLGLETFPTFGSTSWDG